jgi:hypothetical protein
MLPRPPHLVIVSAITGTVHYIQVTSEAAAKFLTANLPPDALIFTHAISGLAFNVTLFFWALHTIKHAARALTWTGIAVTRIYENSARVADSVIRKTRDSAVRALRRVILFLEQQGGDGPST